MTENHLVISSRQGTASVDPDPRRAVPHGALKTPFLGRWGLQLPRMRLGSIRALAPEVLNSTLKRVAFLVFLIALGFAPLWAAQLGYSQHAKEIGMHLRCMCGGCDMSAGGCAHPGGAFSGPCETAKSELREIDQHLAKGESEQQIIDAFVAKYGTVVYMEPPKKGFGLVAWLMPIFYFIAGLALAGFVVHKWRNRQLAALPAGPSVPSDVLERARAQAARETED